MDFEETAEDAAFRAEARAWLEQHAPPLGSEDDFVSDREGGGLNDLGWVKRCKEWQGVLADHGWACINWPVEYGGRGGTSREASIFAQEQSRFGVSNGVFAVGIGMAGPTIIEHGTDAQKERFLPKLLHGDEVWCQLFSEPGAGSDLAGVSTRAVRDGDEWVVNGQKVWTSGAQHSDWGILVARSDVDVPKHRGITYYLVDMTSPGIEIRPLRQMNGGAHFNEVFMTDVSVPHANVLGDVGGGWRAAMTTLSNERALIGGGRNGPDFDDLVDLARQRGLDHDATVRQGLADTHIRSRILEFLGYRVQTATAHGETPGSEASIMKLVYAGHLKRTAELALAIEGPAATLLDADAPADGAWQQSFLSAPSIRIAGGSDEIQRNIIGERVLGLPKEPQVDREIPFREIPRGA